MELPKELLKPYMPDKRQPIPKLIRAMVKEKCNGKCAYCGVDLQDRFHVDHVKPFYRGGECELDNYLPACAKCNNYKLTYSVEEFRRLIERQHDLAYRNSVNYRTALRFGLIVENKHPVVFYFETLQTKEITK